ncbi:hypothetical protein [Mucilaginibacter terrae]|uniref:Uncharacterized protein n=1 Tax=Mucilaginibacter terrae TaxID=1955052 RepID=A0ABU3H0V6_9SPHI|nr:hypothetical protein [Mucilaginibacter terrae]MDT3405550.1 hypothetical protein [Mucilaginibacter terrae]
MELEVEVRKIVQEPKMSLTMMGRLVVATEKGKLGIIKKSKYPSDFVPGYYELARKCLCETFSGNIKGYYDLYFDEFKRKAKEYKKIASTYPKEKVMYKNHFYSAEGLDGIVAMSALLTPLLERYTYYDNLAQKKAAIILNNVRIGAMADMLLHDEYGVDHVGFLKFSFSKTKFHEKEAAVKLHVLKNYYEAKNINVKPKDCILIDVPARRIYTLKDVPNMKETLQKDTLLIRDNWDVI